LPQPPSGKLAKASASSAAENEPPFLGTIQPSPDFLRSVLESKLDRGNAGNSG
jgi:hypothetical protein